MVTLTETRLEMCKKPDFVWTSEQRAVPGAQPWCVPNFLTAQGINMSRACMNDEVRPVSGRPANLSF